MYCYFFFLPSTIVFPLLHIYGGQLRESAAAVAMCAGVGPVTLGMAGSVPMTSFLTTTTIQVVQGFS